MPLDFPSSPANGQVYEQYVYDSALPGWRSKGGAVAATYVSDAAPSGAVKGDMWYRSSDGTTYVYVVDADTSQWVEIRSEISTAQVGLVPLVPASIALGSGSGSVSSSGLITFSGVSSISINGVFGSTYERYRVNIRTNASANNIDLFWRNRANNSNYTINYFGASMWTTYGGSLASVVAVNNGSYGWLYPMGTNNCFSSVDVVPASPTTTFTHNSFTTYASAFVSGGYESPSTPKSDGFTLYGSSGTFSGTIKIYGYN